MRIWTVHTLPEAPAAPLVEAARAAMPRRASPVLLVREGFSWAAFLFGVLWLLWHRLWLAVLGYLLLALALALLLPAGAPSLVGSLALQFLLGSHAGDLRRRMLARCGYRTEEVVAARDLDRATARLLALRPALADRWARAALA